MNENEKGFFQEGTPRVMFYFGLAVGIAAVLVVNTLAIYSGGLKAGNPSVANVGNNNGTVPSAQLGNVLPPEPQGTVVPLKPTDHVKGPKNPKATMIVYTDFECPFCERHHPSVEKLAADFPNDLAIVYRNFPLSFHPQAEPAANAAECAADQNKYWEYASKLFANQSTLGDATYERIASELKLNLNTFKSCYSSRKHAARVSADLQEGGAAGVTGTPASFINGQLVSGAVPYESLKQMVQAAIAQ